MSVVVRADGVVRRGRGIELSDADVAPDALARAIRGETPTGVAVECPPPGAVHDHVGHVRPGMTVSLRGALAAAARTRGETPPRADAIADLRARLDASTGADAGDAGGDETSPTPRGAGGPGDVGAAARRRAAAAGDRERRLRERVATLRGRVQVAREADPDSTAAADAAAELEAAAADLASVETERIAAEQRLDRVERDARAARDAKERRLRAEDRLANLERAARARLAAVVYDEFAAAVDALPGRADPGDGPSAFVGDGVTAALGAARVARVDAPVVVSARRFDSAAEAASRLDAPVIRL